MTRAGCGLALAGLLATAPAQVLPMLDSREAFAEEPLRALADAARDARPGTIDELVASGVNVNGVGAQGFRPVHWALLGSSPDGLRRLLEHGADPNAELENGRTPVFMAAGMESPAFLQLLLQAGGRPEGSPRQPETPLTRALRSKRPANLRLLVAAGANVNARWGGEPLALVAMRIGDYADALALLQAGAVLAGPHGELGTDTLCRASRKFPRLKADAAYGALVAHLQQRGLRFPCNPL